MSCRAIIFESEFLICLFRKSNLLVNIAKLRRTIYAYDNTLSLSCYAQKDDEIFFLVNRSQGSQNEIVISFRGAHSGFLEKGVLQPKPLQPKIYRFYYSLDNKYLEAVPHSTLFPQKLPKKTFLGDNRRKMLHKGI